MCTPNFVIDSCSKEEEIANEQLKNTHNEQLIQNDISLAFSIQEKVRLH